MYDPYPCPPTHPMQAAAFRAWLQTLPEGVPFAEARNCHACPIYEWLLATKTDVAKITRDMIWTRDQVATLPSWAERFVMLLDEFHTPIDAPQVTPEQALRALDAALLQTGGTRDVA